MQSQEWKLAGVPVTGYVWHAENPRGIVLLSHGVGEYAGRYVERYHALIPTLVENGFTVYAYDQRGHGQSAGKRAVVDMNVLVEDHLKAREALRGQPLPVFVYGHSLGGLVTAASVARDPRGLAGAVLSSPALLVGENEPAWLKKIAPIVAKIAPAAPVNELAKGGLSRIPEEVAAYEADPVMYHGKIPALTGATVLALSGKLWPDYARWTLPTLVFHGTDDRITDPKGSQRFFESIKSTDKTFIHHPGGYHELLNDTDRDQIRDAVIGWLRERAS